MNKTELVSAVAKRTGHDEKLVHRVISETVEVIMKQAIFTATLLLTLLLCAESLQLNQANWKDNQLTLEAIPAGFNRSDQPCFRIQSHHKRHHRGESPANAEKQTESGQFHPRS